MRRLRNGSFEGRLAHSVIASLILSAASADAAEDVARLLGDLATQHVEFAGTSYEPKSFPANVKQLVAARAISREVMAAYSPEADALIRFNFVLILAVRLDRDPEELRPADWGEFFLARLDDESPWVRTEAAVAFTRLRYARARPKLEELLAKDEDTDVAFACALALWPYLDQPIYIVAGEAGRRDALEKMLESGFDLEREINKEGWRPLMFAAAEGRLQTVRLLLELGANVNATNDLGRTALMFASIYGYEEIAAVLLDVGADPNIVPTDDSGWPALIAAAEGGHLSVVQRLLEAGADPFMRDKTGATALHHATEHGHEDVVRALTTASARILVR